MQTKVQVVLHLVVVAELVRNRPVRANARRVARALLDVVVLVVHADCEMALLALEVVRTRLQNHVVWGHATRVATAAAMRVVILELRAGRIVLRHVEAKPVRFHELGLQSICFRLVSIASADTGANLDLRIARLGLAVLSNEAAKLVQLAQPDLLSVPVNEMLTTNSINCSRNVTTLLEK